MLMANTQAMNGHETHAQGGCGCGGQEKSGGSCGCGCDKKSKAGGGEPPPSGFDFGQRFSLDSAAEDSTATDPFPLAGGSAVKVCVTIFSQAGAASLDVVVLGLLGDNRFTVTTQTITGGVGYYSFSVTGLVWSELCIGARAYSGSVPIVFSIYAYTSCS
ncbi:MAG: hypothetical protein FD180_4297 [Planctomycetota bacterium]|nr:MAG: hypothetical protein FD180_4297 [Planctomycetota bacterium]